MRQAPTSFRRHLGHALLLALGVSLWWGLVYGGTDLVAARHTFRLRVHLDWEPHVPFVPAAVSAYLSVYLLFAAAPFVLRTRRQLEALAATLAAVIAVAGVCFLLIPAAPAFPPPGDMGPWAGPVRFAKAVALRHNYLPSLHVALSVACAAVYARHAGRAGRALLWLWAAAIAASTLLLHQHYLLDVATGFALGLAGARGVYDRWTSGMPRCRGRSASGQPAPVARAAGLMLPAFWPRARQRRS
jgi:membrane-associated phospholipid phosphatase